MPTTISPLLTIAAFGLSTLLVGGFVGGEFARWRGDKTELKEMEIKHKETMDFMKSTYQLSVDNEKRALAQVDSIYVVLGLLDIREGRVRGDIKTVQDAAKRQRGHTEKARQDLARQDGIIEFGQ